ncbi:hypothetical protein UFOVP1290_122 [uncultured Caudovirales phage]|uniref:Uncharacterized protein n=1 Tax=uncultured Caudovirales phage TaxID=2100421 RepID=A0A6J5RKM0_9CAUD|nr:hypothetical protein UFOVP1290_122 [uncultured Caudovirales phage]
MEDTLFCPICNKKLRTIRLSNVFFERTCTGPNHCLQFKADKNTNKIISLKFSLNSNYSRYIIVDFLLEQSQIICLKQNVPHYINIPKLLELDFPDLVSLKDKVGMFIAFS